MRPGLGFAACQSKKGNSLIIRLLPLQGVGLVWRIFTQGVALGYVLLPLRGVLLVSFDTPPLEGSQNPLLICCPPIQAVIWLGDRLADTPLRGKSASPYSVHNVHVAPLLGDMVDIFTYRCLVIEYTLSALKYNNKV